MQVLGNPRLSVMVILVIKKVIRGHSLSEAINFNAHRTTFMLQVVALLVYYHLYISLYGYFNFVMKFVACTVALRCSMQMPGDTSSDILYALLRNNNFLPSLRRWESFLLIFTAGNSMR